jgi:hypothetical protein
MPNECSNDSEKKKDDSGKKDEVLTPGGYRRKDLVREVKPGQVVRREADGTYSVVSEEPENTSEENKKK